MKPTSQIQSDVQAETHHALTALNWVGMGQIQSSLNIGTFNTPVLLDLGVNLKAGYRGIHMSRLYQIHQDYFLHQKLHGDQFATFLKMALESQAELSDQIMMKTSLQFPMQTKSLKSERPGFRNYPVQVIVERNATTQTNFLQFEVLYSSTCPQSASLSMEILKSQTTMPERLPATPHAQRSRAQVRVQIKNFFDERIRELILLTEGVLKTPVQTAVKKADEMEFAVLNAQNLMFCEDAARLVAEALVSQADILGFSVFCEHQESLHPHNASSLIVHNLKAQSGLTFS